MQNFHRKSQTIHNQAVSERHWFLFFDLLGVTLDMKVAPQDQHFRAEDKIRQACAVGQCKSFSNSGVTCVLSACFSLKTSAGAREAPWRLRVSED